MKKLWRKKPKKTRLDIDIAAELGRALRQLDDLYKDPLGSTREELEIRREFMEKRLPAILGVDITKL